MKPISTLLVLVFVLCLSASINGQVQLPVFSATGTQHTDTLYTRRPGYPWGHTMLEALITYQPGYLQFQGFTVPVNKVVQSKFKLIELPTDKHSHNSQPASVSLGEVGLAPATNNFSYCFGLEGYNIVDPVMILNNLYKRCVEAEAEIIVLYAAHGVDEAGKIVLHPIHAGILHKDHTVSFKSSIWTPLEHVPKTAIQQDYNYNAIAYFRKNK